VNLSRANRGEKLLREVPVGELQKRKKGDTKKNEKPPRGGVIGFCGSNVAERQLLVFFVVLRYKKGMLRQQCIPPQ